MTDYACTQPFHGNASSAIELACVVLASIGFRIDDRTPTRIEAVGPGLSNSRQNALLGASLLRIHCAGGSIHLEAELAGLRRLARFVTWFPIVMTVSLAAILAVTFQATLGPGAWPMPLAAIVGGNGMLWLVLSPLAIRTMRRRTLRSIDDLAATLARA